MVPAGGHWNSLHRHGETPPRVCQRGSALTLTIVAILSHLPPSSTYLGNFVKGINNFFYCYI